jgi:Holliday junction DNA helicase RuvA
MYDSITGTLVCKDAAGVVVSAGGLGYRLGIPQRIQDRLPENGEITLYTHLAVKDDSLKLYGFPTPGERDLFLKIMSVSGIGAATALNLLSQIPPREFLRAVAEENAALMQSVKKVGARTAKRLIVELKGKVELEGFAPEEGGPLPAGNKDLGQDLVAALQSLGYPRPAARDAATKALASNPQSEDLEQLLKSALSSL